MSSEFEAGGNVMSSEDEYKTMVYANEGSIYNTITGEGLQEK
jgi:hypothetical protein